MQWLNSAEAGKQGSREVELKDIAYGALGAIAVWAHMWIFYAIYVLLGGE